MLNIWECRDEQEPTSHFVWRRLTSELFFLIMNSRNNIKKKPYIYIFTRWWASKETSEHILENIDGQNDFENII